jgi:formamidopyrimidine-DNA glycosylase
MPELPEVENVRRSLKRIVPAGARSRRLTLHRPDLRFPFPLGLSEKLVGERLLDIHRRAKYLIFETDRFWLLSHLGMTGSWRELSTPALHDHLEWEFENGPTLVFNDPRRFGFVSLHDKSRKLDAFEALGPEPLEEDFDAEYLLRISRGKLQPLKSFLLDQKNVAGLGNIYVCEALFLSGLSPFKKARQLKLENCRKIVKSVRKILLSAIDAGGSTIRDYKNAEGKSGAFQNGFRVYGRDGEACRKCRGPIRIRRQAGRSTFWCATCQK